MFDNFCFYKDEKRVQVFNTSILCFGMILKKLMNLSSLTCRKIFNKKFY